METAVAILVGLLFATAVYLMLSTRTIRILIGISILGNAVNLLIFTTGRLSVAKPPVLALSEYVPSEPVANALPQALILTAIVISFSFFAFLLVLAFRAYQDLGTDDTGAMRVAEPAHEPGPPQGY
jgi:multicomponent Na+:H+ antiporter subunit C